MKGEMHLRTQYPEIKKFYIKVKKMINSVARSDMSLDSLNKHVVEGVLDDGGLYEAGMKLVKS